MKEKQDASVSGEGIFIPVKIKLIWLLQAVGKEQTYITQQMFSRSHVVPWEPLNLLLQVCLSGSTHISLHAVYETFLHIYKPYNTLQPTAASAQKMHRGKLCKIWGHLWYQATEATASD